MQRWIVGLWIAGLLVVGCGEPEATPPHTETEPPPTEALPAAETEAKPGASAFRLMDDPAAVRHTLRRPLFRKGIPRPDPRDAIPAILEPRFIAAKDFEPAGEDPRVIVVQIGEAIHAYPIYILDLHELVNDVVGGEPVLVSWCPLCGSSVVYSRKVGEDTLTFGVSGYLYKSDVLMYDHQSETFWSQLQLEAVAGPRTGDRLTVLPSRMLRFDVLQQRHPQASVLMEDPEMWKKGSYARSPYPGYAESERIWFPVGKKSKLLHPKAEVIGVVRRGGRRAYALEGLRRLSKPLTDTLGDETLTLTYDAKADEVRVRDAQGRELIHYRLFWFAWFAFHKDTDLWRGAGRRIVTPATK